MEKTRESSTTSLIIGIVGPCSAGKTTLIRSLQQLGYEARHIAQEHSFVPDMWQRMTRPDVLIYLDVSFAVSQSRRFLNWNELEFREQVQRLEHARQHANLEINTDLLNPLEVQKQVLNFLSSRYF